VEVGEGCGRGAITTGAGNIRSMAMDLRRGTMAITCAFALPSLITYAPLTEGWVSSPIVTDFVEPARWLRPRGSVAGYPRRTHAEARIRTILFNGDVQSLDFDHQHAVDIPEDVKASVRSIAEKVWGGKEAFAEVSPSGVDDGISGQGEMPLPDSVPIPDRYTYFLEQAENEGDARAQHSVGLLLWNGFAEDRGLSIDSEQSAKYHAAAAVQGNLDALAVFGGCLRTGTGVGKHKDIVMGIRCIEHAASVGNPSGINKKAAMLEANDDWYGAFRLYKDCYDDDSKRNNALLLFNLGYCLVEGEGTYRAVESGLNLWKDAVSMSPDEGSEEAAWFLHQHYERDDAKLARKYLDIAAALGHQEAMDKVDKE